MGEALTRVEGVEGSVCFKQSARQSYDSCRVVFVRVGEDVTVHTLIIPRSHWGFSRETGPDFRKNSCEKPGSQFLVFLIVQANTSLSLQALDSDQGSNESDTEQRNKALRGRM